MRYMNTGPDLNCYPGPPLETKTELEEEWRGDGQLFANMFNVK